MEPMETPLDPPLSSQQSATAALDKVVSTKCTMYYSH